jgi:hypothetical protein
LMTRGKVVVDHGSVALLSQLLYRMASYITRPAGDQYYFIHSETPIKSFSTP